MVECLRIIKQDLDALYSWLRIFKPYILAAKKRGGPVDDTYAAELEV